MKLYRIGDRSLAQLLSGYQFLRQLDGYDISSIADQMGEPVWEGQLAIANELNKEVTTSFPVDEALPQPQARRLCADRAAGGRPERRAGTRAPRNGSSSPTSGFRPIPARTGSTSSPARWASAKPLAGVELTLLARNNEILGTATTDADGRATFNPGLTRGDGGHGAGGADGQAGRRRLRLPRHDPRRLRPVRPRRHRPRGARRARRLCLDRARHLPRRRDRACRQPLPATTAAQGGRQPAADLRLHPARRRRGPPHRQPTAAMPAAMPSTCRCPATAMRGTWTVAVHTDPKQPAVASQMFLVEDFVPDRIEFDLTADRDGDRPPARPPTSPSTAASSMARRPPASSSKAS